MKKEFTPEQLAATAARRERFKTLCKRISAMDGASRATLAAKCNAIVTAEGHPLSVFNTCLAIMQRPDATVVGGFKQWRKLGRRVKKGSTGIAIWVPTGEKHEAGIVGEPSGEEAEGVDVRFLGAYVFDVSDTEEGREAAA